ncbi:MAG TPA: sugar transferase [Verrucomicrobiae bacterium]|jgi:exopolysaccharide biosynthesis polyprenyl glycosylphosphotransferase|nr:sugar transferase [Verrucomicrobiae bacterium]
MLRRDKQMRMQMHQLVDACLFAISFWVAYELRTDVRVAFHLGLKEITRPFDDYVWLYLILIPLAPLVLEQQGYYDRPILSSRRSVLWPLFKSCVIIALCVLLALFLFRMINTMPRWVLVWFGAISFSMVYLKEEVVRAVLRTNMAKEQYMRRFILVGASAEIEQLRKEFEAQPEGDMHIVGEVNLNETSIQSLINMLHEHSVNGVILSAKHTYFEQIETAIRACEVEGVEAWLAADFFKTQISRTSMDNLLGRPMLVFRATPESSWQGVMKMLMDFFGASLLLIIFAVPLLLVAIIIKLTSRGPVMFKQQRAGLNGRPFMIYKFRTMVTNAEQLKDELERMNEMSGPVFKVTKDPRITSFGKFLRKFSIDEFPQLINVVRGEMSLVGPRPLPVYEVRRFDDMSYRRRLSVKPGITCLWQVSGRNNVTDFKDWVRLDLEYIDNWSLWLDVKILLRTLPAVLSGAGAK